MSDPRPATLVYSHGGGRYGNQLLRYAHFIAWAKEFAGQVEIIDLAMWPYVRTLATYDESPAAIYPPRASTLTPFARVISALPETISRSAFTKLRERLTPSPGRRRFGMLSVDARHDDGPGIDLADPEFFASVCRAKSIWLQGFRIASWPLFERHTETLRTHLRLHERYLAPARATVEAMRRDRPFVIGVLCRQTDYRLHHNGLFFLSTEQYRKRMEEICELYGGSDRVAFVVTGDEVLAPAAFDGLTWRLATGSKGQTGHFLESLAALSMCDLVVGAPSTFAAWAAFLGDKPYLPVMPDREASLDHVLRQGLSEAARHPVYGRTII